MHALVVVAGLLSAAALALLLRLHSSSLPSPARRWATLLVGNLLDGQVPWREANVLS